MNLPSPSRFQNTKNPVLRFRVVLGKGTEDVRFEQVTVSQAAVNELV
jgi:hypothetical protein